MVDRFNSQEQRWADEFARFKKDVLDRLENIDYDNFSPNAKKLIAESAKGRAGFEAYADDTSSVARMFAEYDKALAEIKAVSDSSGAMIAAFATRVNDLEIRSAGIEATVSETNSSLTGLASSVGDNITSIAQLRLESDSNGAFIDMFAVSGNYNIDISKGYTYDKDNKQYIFKDADGNDIFVNSSEFAGMYISAMNNNYSLLKLRADVIQLGDNASVDNYGNFFAKKLWGDSSGTATMNGITYPGFFFAEVGSGRFDHEKDRLIGADFYMKDIYGSTMYGFKHDFTESESFDSVNFMVRDESVWGYNYGQGKFYPKQNWDFSNCNVSGLGVVPVFG